MEKVVVEVPVKNVTDERMFVKFEPDALSLTVRYEHDGIYSLELNLHDAVLPDRCFYKIRRAKIELHLPKKAHSRWGKLQKEEKPIKSNVSKPLKNWDAVVNGLMNADDEFDSSTGSMFEQIFEMGDADQQRAMMKSLSESHGTVLNMNWAEVGKKKIEPYQRSDSAA